MILLVDNNDSFTYNIVDMLGRITSKKVDVVNSDRVEIESLDAYESIILSPGPSLPSDYPRMHSLLKNYIGKTPILGICLGHQAICEYFGGELSNYQQPLHGFGCEIKCDSDSVLFKNIDTMSVGRYHSWVVEEVGEELRVTATDKHGDIMAVENRELKVFGVQFHPESYICRDGEIILKNFLNETAN